MEISPRQALILNFIDNNANVQTQNIREHLAVSLGTDISRMTVIRDIEVLLKNGFVQKKGLGRSVVYEITPKGTLLSPIDSKVYFEKSPDQRVNTKKTFQQDIFESMEYLFSAQEFLQLDAINDEYEKRVSALSPTALRKEFERLTIELSWKSSQIEGNTYSLIDTEILLRQRKEAEGHKKEEAIMLINHKRAIEYIHENASMFEALSLRNIEDVHAILIEGLGVTRGLRKNIVGITGTVYRPLDNEFQVREAMEQMIKTINGISHPLWKALVFVLLLSYIQPFEDGNKRTSRLVGNAVLLAHNYCPLSYRSVDESEYKKAVLLFYEKNNASMFKKIFVDQFKFAVENYF